MSDLVKQTGMIPDKIGNTNPGKDIVFDGKPLSITLEKINEIIMEYLVNTVAPSIEVNGELRVVPVLYGHGERWAQVQKEGVVRDPENQKLLSPLIMINRSNVSQGQIVNPMNKYMYTTLQSGWNHRNAYDKFAVQNGIIPSKQLQNVVIPDYIDLQYEILLWTEYQVQMDRLIEQLYAVKHEFWGNRNNFKFRVKFDEFERQGGNSFSVKGESPAVGDRVVRSQFNMIVSAYLIPESIIRNFKHMSVNQTAFTAKKIIIKEKIVNDIENE